MEGVSTAAEKTFVPWVEKMVDVLQSRCEEVGTCTGFLRIINLGTGNGDDSKADRFTVTFPYGGQHLKWEVIFNANYPHLPPDFIFIGEEESFFPEMDNLKHLCNWNANNPAMLFLVVRELVGEYRDHHLRLLAGSRLEFEYNSLISDEALTTTKGSAADDDDDDGGGDDDDDEKGSKMAVEVHVAENEEGQLGPVQFMVRLPVNFKSLPPVFNEENQGEDKVLILVTFQSLEGGNVRTQKCLSPRVEAAFSKLGGLPPISFPHEGCINDYISSITQHVQKMVDQLCESFERRREYISHAVSLLASHIIEFDAITFWRADFLFEEDNGHHTTATTPQHKPQRTPPHKVDLPMKFPSEQPILTFISTCNLHSSLVQPMQKVNRSYPFSPRWSTHEMVTRLRQYVTERLPGVDRDLNALST
ncbi:hypothetical protein HELRODRAFT_193162 [Helobdella robusta]|uniref:BRISC and BRCA1-A complex member 2 n=1 Tax=Helobdella robusta TaxID=6412 RepID=T1FUP2_HELRO|nr:hypothetical protein HELRODRAFT_193162 [Helobdella robusta]ESN97993.1 hypothetical protein HELRODRAFT_193162 [Helobdella robusta]